jgi:hypothetical protein
MSLNQLEMQYRQVLRWYPQRWRRKNGDAMVGTLLDIADAERRVSPAEGELRSLRLSGLRHHLGSAGHWIPNSVRDRAAGIALGLGASMGLAGIAFNLIVPPNVEAVVARVGELKWMPHLFGAFGGDAVILYGMWVIAGLFGMTGLRRLARILAALTVPVAVVIYVMRGQLSELLTASSTTLGSMELLALLVLAGQSGRGRVGRIAVLASFLAATAFTVVTALTMFRPSFYSFGYTRDGFTQIDELWLAFVAPLALLTAAVLAQTRLRAWAGALALTVVPIAITYGLAGSDGPNLLNWALIAACVGLAAVGIWVTLRRFGFQLNVSRSPKSLTAR